MFPPLSFGTFVYLAFAIGGLLCPVVALRNGEHKYRWIRASLWLLTPFMFGMGFLSLVLRYNTLHLGRYINGCSWVVNHLCTGASFALFLLLAFSEDTYRFLSGPGPGSDRP